MTRKALWHHPIHLLAFGFGSGLAPVAPGTFGTLMACLLYLLLAKLPVAHYLIIVVIIAVVGIYICGKTAKNMGVHDHGSIVWDEFVGLWITLIAAPTGWYWIVVGFVLFRFFDIIKPWPIRWLDQQVKGGIGIMVDDIVAGVMAFLCLQGLYYFL